MRNLSNIFWNHIAFAFTFLACVLFIGCEQEERMRKQIELCDTSVEVNGYRIATMEFDSCQYLVSGVGPSQMMSHKGNCKFCIERSNK